jgi:hypothetical protein
LTSETKDPSKFIYIPISKPVHEIGSKLALSRGVSIYRLLTELILDRAISDGFLKAEPPFQFQVNAPFPITYARTRSGDLEWVHAILESQ